MDSQPIVTINPGDGVIAARDFARTDPRKYHVYGSSGARPGTYICLEWPDVIFYYVSLFHDNYFNLRIVKETELGKAKDHLSNIVAMARLELGILPEPHWGGSVHKYHF